MTRKVVEGAKAMTSLLTKAVETLDMAQKGQLRLNMELSSDGCQGPCDLTRFGMPESFGSIYVRYVRGRLVRPVASTALSPFAKQKRVKSHDP